MHTKILAATIAVLLCWIALKLWFAPPKDLFAAALMVGKGLVLSTIFFSAGSWLSEKWAKWRSAD
jgi:hypothetical protein